MCQKIINPILQLICRFDCFHLNCEFIMWVNLNCEIPLKFIGFSHEIIVKTIIRCTHTHNERQFHNRIKRKQLSNHKFEKVDTLLCLPVIAPKLSFIWRSKWNVKRAVCSQILTWFFFFLPCAICFGFYLHLFSAYIICCQRFTRWKEPSNR